MRGSKTSQKIVAQPEDQSKPVATEEKQWGLTIEQVIIECGCAFIVLLLSGICVNVVSVSPLWTSLRSYSAETNAKLFVGMVCLAYVVFRAYFGASYYIWSRLSKAYPVLQSSSVEMARGFISSSVLLGLVGLYFLFPQSKQALYNLAIDAMGELPEILGASMDTEYKRVYQRVWKLGGLFFGWFLFFLAGESILRVLLMLFVAVWRAIMAGLGSNSIRKSTLTESESESEEVVEEETE